MVNRRSSFRIGWGLPTAVVAVAVLLVAGAAGASDAEKVNPFTALNGPKVAHETGFNGDPTYTGGPNICANCHPQAFEDWLSHGHARKLALTGSLTYTETGDRGATTGARDAGVPLPSHDPDVYNWDNIMFVVGASKHWKSRYVGMDGYFLTVNGKNQYNWRTGEFVDYHADEVDKPFDCSPCHTTGYRSPEDGGDTFQTDFDMPGIIGDFAHMNITCEACHGPGAEHAAAPSTSNIIVDTSAEACGTCHTRGDDPQVALASGDFIRHHEQWPEMNIGAHSFLDCGSCHDPHVGRARGVGDGQNEICGNCHPDEVEEYDGSAMQAAGVKCQDCHMGLATKSAAAMGPYEGDVWSHIFEIDSSADYDMFNRDGEGAAVSAKGAISLEYACFRCHAGADKAAYAAIGDSGTAYHTID